MTKPKPSRRMKWLNHLQAFMASIFLISGWLILTYIDFKPGLIGFITTNPPALISAIILMGSGIGLFTDLIFNGRDYEN